MKNKLAKLIDLKSIITIVMVIAFVAGFFMGKISPNEFIPLMTMILTFYFVKNDKNKGSEENDN